MFLISLLDTWMQSRRSVLLLPHRRVLLRPVGHIRELIRPQSAAHATVPAQETCRMHPIRVCSHALRASVGDRWCFFSSLYVSTTLKYKRWVVRSDLGVRELSDMARSRCWSWIRRMCYWICTCLSATQHGVYVCTKSLNKARLVIWTNL